MQTFPNALRSILVVLWIGGLWVAGVLVPVALIHHVDDALLFLVIDRLFLILAWLGIAAGIYVLLHMMWNEGLRAIQTVEFWLIFGMLVLTLINQFAVFPILSQVKPEMHAAAQGIFGGGFQSWRTISSLIYLVQSVLGLFYVIRGPVK